MALCQTSTLKPAMLYSQVGFLSAPAGDVCFAQNTEKHQRKFTGWILLNLTGVTLSWFEFN